jgi:hypothetical protein
LGGEGRWREVGGERRWREEVERKKKTKKEKEKKSDVAFHIRLWRFGCGDLGVSVAALE